MQAIKQKIKAISSDFKEDTIRLRRFIHQHPELSQKEFQTAKFIYDTLHSYGIEAVMELNNTAVVALIEGKTDNGKCLALRADIDALPIEEKGEKEYSSIYQGVSHACGHDVHTASLLTTARILLETKEDWSGKVKLIFQPSEEEFPGGAIQLIDKEVLKNPDVDFMLGMHVSPEIETGKIGSKKGAYMASTDEIHITITGKGGHAALVQTFINPLQISAEILTETDKRFSSSKPKNTPSVLTFGRIIGEGKTNIVPQNVYLAGTLRTFDDSWREKSHRLIVETAENIAQKYGGTVNGNIKKGYPVLINDECLYEVAISEMSSYLGEENILSLPYRMTSDDFAYFSRLIPSFFYRLGVKKQNQTLNLHTPEFDIDENALDFAPGVMAFLAIRLLHSFNDNEK